MNKLKVHVQINFVIKFEIFEFKIKIIKQIYFS
jgi:hypothetical protein